MSCLLPRHKINGLFATNAKSAEEETKALSERIDTSKPLAGLNESTEKLVNSANTFLKSKGLNSQKKLEH